MQIPIIWIKYNFIEGLSKQIRVEVISEKGGEIPSLIFGFLTA